jgi:outer membrane lipoprotein-sorting protein
MRISSIATVLLLIAWPATPVSPKDALAAVLARMDKSAGEFKSMTADVIYVTHTDVINEDSTESGNVAMQKMRSDEVRGLINILIPDKKTVAFENRLLRIYFPKIKTVQEYKLDKFGEQLDQFLMIGFGTSGMSLAKDYGVTVLGSETLKGPEAVATIRVRLIPKSQQARDLVKQFELWIPETGDPYPLQEKISQPSGDYRLITYSNMKTNQPLKADALQLNLPRGVKTEHPGQ